MNFGNLAKLVLHINML